MTRLTSTTKSLFVASVGLLLLLSSCARVTDAIPLSDVAVSKVVVFGVPAVTLEDLRDAGSENLDSLLRDSAVGNMSIRISNFASDGYATLSAAQRTQSDMSGGWAFNSDEHIENGTGLDLYQRRGGLSDASTGVFVAGMDQLRKYNELSGFDAALGSLAGMLVSEDRISAVIGNADHGIGPLPTRLPSPRKMSLKGPPETGIHREAALAAMQPNGRVPLGDVTRSLLRLDPSAPFGISTDPARLTEAFKSVAQSADLIVIETGETSRADAYSLGLSREDREDYRKAAIRRVFDDLVPPILRSIDPQTMIIFFTPNNPGGPDERGQLRPVIISSSDIQKGILTSKSTRRKGIVTAADIGATVANRLGLTSNRFQTGRVVDVIPGSPRIDRMVDRNSRAVVHDWARARFAVAVNGLQLMFFLLVVWVMRRRNRLPRSMRFLLIASLAFPLASFVTVLGVWRLGRSTVGLFGFLGIFAVAWLCWLAGRRNAMDAALWVLAATFVFFLLDLALGGAAQLDSMLGYTSVGAGRFFGLGNLPFAIFSTSALLLAGMLADRLGRERVLIPLGLVGVALVWIVHPSLGNDVGGTLAMLAAGLAFAYTVLGPGSRSKIVLLIAGAVMVVVGFAAFEFLRPVSDRTHLGDFLRGLLSDPAAQWVVVRRKLEIALDLAVSTRWALMLPVTAAILIWLHKRSRGRWSEVMADRPGLRAGLDAAIVAAVAGSVLNDSGVAVGGMMLAIAVPWALVIASETTALD